MSVRICVDLSLQTSTSRSNLSVKSPHTVVTGGDAEDAKTTVDTVGFDELEEDRISEGDEPGDHTDSDYESSDEELLQPPPPPPFPFPFESVTTVYLSLPTICLSVHMS